MSENQSQLDSLKFHQVQFLTQHQDWPYNRQTSGHGLKWEDLEFDINGTEKTYDYLVVFDDLLEDIEITLPIHKRILIITEPPEIKKYESEFLLQFGILITPQQIPGLPDTMKQVITHAALPWHYGVNHNNRMSDYLSYEDLKTLVVPTKENKVSTVISTKAFTKHQRVRKKTAYYLKENLKDKFQLFGRGLNEIDDKSMGIDPYTFHLVCENNDIPNFWTEKLADAFLGWSFPIYSGCENLVDYFPSESFIHIDVRDKRKTLEVISDLLNTPGFYDSRIQYIEKSRNLILSKYNMFALIASVIEEHGAVGVTRRSSVMLKKQNHKFSIIQRAINQLHTVLN